MKRLGNFINKIITVALIIFTANRQILSNTGDYSKFSYASGTNLGEQ